MDHTLVRVSAEDRRQVQADVNGTRYHQKDGYFHMKPADAQYHLKVGNLPSPPAALPVGRRGGYRCTSCGFGTYFVTCSRCGAECRREA